MDCGYSLGVSPTLNHTVKVVLLMSHIDGVYILKGLMERHFAFMAFFSETHKPSLVMWKMLHKLKLVDFLQNAYKNMSPDF